MITPAQHAEIRRLYYGEHWTVGTIAAQLGVHPDTVRAAIADTRAVRRGTCRPTKLDPYLPLVRDRLTQYPRLRATRLHEMLRVRGYLGSATQMRRLVRGLRPQIVAPVYRRLRTLIGEDYGEPDVMVSARESKDVLPSPERSRGTGRAHNTAYKASSHASTSVGIRRTAWLDRHGVPADSSAWRFIDRSACT